MNYSVKSIVVFERQARKLSKKYPSLKQELLTLVDELKENPIRGKAVLKFVWLSSLRVRANPVELE